MSNNIDLPTLEAYGLSENGFLPKEMPATKLSDEYYRQWEAVANSLPSLLLSKKIRSVVDRLPVLKVKQELIEDLAQLRRAYSVLCFITNAYIWGYDEPCDTLPDCIAKPLLIISERLGLPPLATYASLVLWNYKPIVDDPALVEDVMDLSNLTTINTFTGGMDESWFYLVSVMTEKIGSHCVTRGLRAIQAARDRNTEALIRELKLIAEAIDNLGSVLMKMEAMCDPHIFYFRIRPYLAGWKNMAEIGLPKGVRYGDQGEYKTYAGGSNAQSSLIQALDILLGIEHFPMGKKRPSDERTISSNSNQNSFINDMRQYMPREHRNFLEHLSLVSNIRDFVLKTNDNELTLAYDACLAMLKSFRDKHIQIVTRYVVLQANKKPRAKSSVLRSGLSKTHGKKEQKGTGGTSLIPFLKQCRDETGSLAASSWGKKILSTAVLDVHEESAVTNVGKRRPAENADISNNKRLKQGVSSTWKVEGEDEGANYAAGHW